MNKSKDKSTKIKKSAMGSKIKTPKRKKIEEIKPKEEKVLDWVEDKVALPPESKSVPKKVKIITGYLAKYVGKHKHMSLSPGIGNVVPGKWYKVDKSLAYTLGQAKNWVVKEECKYVDATKI